MIGWALPAMVMDPPSRFPSTLTRLVETDGCVSTDGVRSSESSGSQKKNQEVPFWAYGIYMKMMYIVILLCNICLLGTWSFSVMWSTDSLIPTGGTIRATRLLLDVVTVVSSSSTMMTGKVC